MEQDPIVHPFVQWPSADRRPAPQQAYIPQPRSRREQVPNPYHLLQQHGMANKRKSDVLDSAEKSLGKRQRRQALNDHAMADTATNSDELLEYVKPTPDFLSVLTCCAPFEDGLRESGFLNKYDYTNLRMSCKTTAKVLKPYPYGEAEPDTKDPFFAELRLRFCSHCGNGSDKFVVKPCAGYGPRQGCHFDNSFVCIHCVTSGHRHRHLDREEREVCACRPCSEAFRVNGTLQRCQCGYRTPEDIVRPSEWQCWDCTVTANGFEEEDLHGLMDLEAIQSNIKANQSHHRSAIELSRWSGPYSKCCPSCGCLPSQIRKSWTNVELDDNFHWPRHSVRVCLTCHQLRE